MTTPKRLIEVDLPIKKISAHARREKSIRHGHISTLHIWWARRPLAACRAVICAALWPDPADEQCPQAFREAAATILADFAEQVRNGAQVAGLVKDHWQRWRRTNKATFHPADNFAVWPDMREALLDFIADFANWDASTVPAFLNTARALTQAAHESLGGLPGTRPLVVDPFAGGGAIPLEALRVGADAFASDLNPVAVLLNKVVLEYIPKYGKMNAEVRMMNDEQKKEDSSFITHHSSLAEAVRYWGRWIKEQAEKELAEFYPKDPDGATPIAYLWARTIISEAPDDGTGIPVEVPLMRSLWLAKKSSRSVALRWVRDENGRVKTETVTVNYERRKTNDERGTMNDESKTNSSFITHHSSLVGDWRDVLQELPQRIHAWLPRLAQEGVVGADAIFACLGPALEIFSRYSRVEKASGEPVLLKEYLEQVWAVVSKEALSMVFAGADATGFEEDARLAAMWLWTLNTNDELRMMNDEGNDESGMMNDESDSSFIVHHSTFALEYDAARKIAQGLGAHLERLGSLVEVKGETARLLPVSARAGYLFGKDSQVSQAPARPKKRSAQLSLFETTAEGGEQNDEYRMMNDEFDSSFIVHHSSFTILDRVHQSMLLFAAGRSDALKRFLVDEGVGQNTRFWQLANALSALYPPGTDEKRWVEGVLARKKGLGF